MSTALDGAFDALVAGRHADPFALLGPHVEHGQLVIRAFLPEADRVQITRDGAEPVEMARRYAGGIFEAQVPGVDRKVHYALRVTFPGGHVADLDDPYRFSRLISEYDLYLFGEGKHTRLYERLGAHVMPASPLRVKSAAIDSVRSVGEGDGATHLPVLCSVGYGSAESCASYHTP